MGLIKNKKFKILSKAVICVLLCVLLGLQSLVFAAEGYASKSYNHAPVYDEKYKDYYLIANIDDELAELDDGSINPLIDELLELYEELSLYGLTREQAIISMLKKFLIDYPDLMPYLGDSLLTAFDNFGGYYANISTRELFSSAYRGYGIMLGGKKTLDGNYYDVIIQQVFVDSPAFFAGLKAGDEIIKIENINVENLGMNAVSHILSTYSDKVSMTVRRNGKEITVSMNRGTVIIQAVSFFTDETTKTAMIKIDNFTDEYMLYDIFDIYDFLCENDYKNIIIDLRDNPGGEMWNMLETLNIFVPEEGAVLCSVIDRDGESESVLSSGDGLAFEKICVLTNGRSASASEIFALSLQELTGAVIIGEKTYGKGVGQWYVPLSNGDTAAITAFELLSANGTSYHKTGVKPDIKISPEYIDIERKTLGQLNFVNCINIKKDADNNAILALNQRLAAMGYISPEDVTSECTQKTITAVEIFQKYNDLPVGISKIDYMFLEYLNYYVAFYSVSRYEERDVQLECAEVYIEKGEQAAIDYAEEFN
ncbi:MAG: S41 family peptidase [Oscillospiraceae bacterium]|nr:S41 family peptidase [Oscillospiraceae bacterium]